MDELVDLHYLRTWMVSNILTERLDDVSQKYKEGKLASNWKVNNKDVYVYEIITGRAEEEEKEKVKEIDPYTEVVTSCAKLNYET